MTDTKPARLYGYGRLSWTQVCALLYGCECTWTDLDGIHVTDVPPDVLPLGANHLWGWAADVCVRVRFDGGEAAYAALLRMDEGEGDGGPEALIAEVVTPVIRRPVTWSPDDRQAGPLPEAVRRRGWELLEAPGVSPVTSVRA